MLLSRRRAAAVLSGAIGAALVGDRALASTSPPPDIATLLGLPPQEGPYLLPAGLDPTSRLTVPVFVGDAGPFEFIVDTGADRSVLASNIAEGLGLKPGAQVLLHAVDGSARMPTVRVSSMRAGAARMRDAELPVVAQERLGADGLLGVDILEGHNVVMDFHRKHMEIRGQGLLSMVRSPSEISVNAGERFGRLVIVDAQVGGARAQVFVDSGSGLTIGNRALAQAIARRQRTPSVGLPVRMYGVVGRETEGEVRLVRTMRLGQVTFTNCPIVFTDLHIFEHWGINDRPAVLLGADLLKGFSRVQLDFGAGRVRFLLGHGAPAPMLQA